MRGAYVLSMILKKDSDMDIGSLGKINFEKGRYYYVGSAKGTSVNIENRTSRHRKIASDKKGNLRWHIDYFLSNPEVSLEDVVKIENGDECSISKKLESCAERTIGRFGSSDCEKGCKGHLHYFKGRPDIEEFDR